MKGWEKLQGIIIILLILSFILFLPIPSSHAEEEVAPVLTASHYVTIQRYSGALVFETNITISNPSNTSSIKVPTFSLGYPINVTEKVVYWRAEAQNSRVEVKIREEGNMTFYDIDLSRWASISPGSSIHVFLYIYAHSLLENPNPSLYQVTIPNHPSFARSLQSLDITIYAPPPTSFTDYPEDLQIKGGGSTLSRHFENVPPLTYQDITLTLEPADIPNILLIYANITREFQLGADGRIHVIDKLGFVNRGTIEAFPQGSRIEYHPPPGNATDLRAYTPMKRGVTVELWGDDIILIEPPYELKPGQRFFIIFEYNLNETFRLKGWSIVEYDYQLLVKSNIDALVENFTINIYSPTGKLLDQRHLTYIPPFFEDTIDIQGSFSIFEMASTILQPLGILGIILSLAFIGYRALSIYLLGGVTPEVRDYLSLVKEEIELFRGLIKLEDGYVKRRIGDREYIQGRTRLRREMGSLSSRLASLEGRLSKGGYLSDIEKNIVDGRRRLMETRKRLESLRSDLSSRRIRFKDYRNRMKEVRREMEGIIDELETNISMLL